MPKMVDEPSESEKQIEKVLRDKFTDEQLCAYFLTKTIRSQYQFDDEFISGWYEEIFCKETEAHCQCST